MSYKSGQVYVDEDYYEEKENGKYPLVIMLPHSCDEWIIGNPDQARLMIADLKEAINTLEAKDSQNERN